MSSKYVKDVRRKIKSSAIPVTSTWHVPADLSYWGKKKKKDHPCGLPLVLISHLLGSLCSPWRQQWQAQ